MLRQLLAQLNRRELKRLFIIACLLSVSCLSLISVICISSCSPLSKSSAQDISSLEFEQGVYDFFPGLSADDKVLVQVNDAQITSSAFVQQLIAYAYKNNLRSSQDWEDFFADLNIQKSDFLRELRSQLVVERLLCQDAQSRNIKVDDDYINKLVSKVRHKYPNKRIWEQSLACNGYTEQSYKDATKTSLLIEYLSEKLKDSKDQKAAEGFEMLSAAAEPRSKLDSQSVELELSDKDLENTSIDAASIPQEYIDELYTEASVKYYKLTGELESESASGSAE